MKKPLLFLILLALSAPTFAADKLVPPAMTDCSGLPTTDKIFWTHSTLVDGFGYCQIVSYPECPIVYITPNNNRDGYVIVYHTIEKGTVYKQEFATLEETKSDANAHLPALFKQYPPNCQK